MFKVLVHLGSELVGAVRTGPILEVNAFESGEDFFLQPTNHRKSLVFGRVFFPVSFASYIMLPNFVFVTGRAKRNKTPLPTNHDNIGVIFSILRLSALFLRF